MPAGLIDQIERRDVRDAMEALRKDEVSMVRYFTILALGPAKHQKELKELAQGPDRKIAAWAAQHIAR